MEMDEKFSPGKSLGPTPEQRARIDKMAARIEAAKRNVSESEGPDNGNHVLASPIAIKIDRIAKQRDGLASLCGEILATFSLPFNAAFFTGTDEQNAQWAEAVASWTRRFGEHSGEY